MCAFALVFCLIWGLTPAAEGISVKLRGKIALAGILSGLAYTTHTLMKRDRRAVEKLQHHLGPPDRIVQFERGFDVWRIDYYRERHYIFRNNRLTEIKRNSCQLSVNQRQERWKDGRKEYASSLPVFHASTFPPFLIDTPVLGSPRWSRLYLAHLQRAPQFVSSYPYRLVDARLLGLEPWLSH